MAITCQVKKHKKDRKKDKQLSQAGLRVEVRIRNNCSSVHLLISWSHLHAKRGQACAWHLWIGWGQVDTTGAINAAALTQAKSSTQPCQVGVDTIHATHTLGTRPSPTHHVWLVSNSLRVVHRFGTTVALKEIGPRLVRRWFENDSHMLVTGAITVGRSKHVNLYSDCRVRDQHRFNLMSHSLASNRVKLTRTLTRTT